MTASSCSTHMIQNSRKLSENNNKQGYDALFNLHSGEYLTAPNMQSYHILRLSLENFYVPLSSY